MSMSKNLEDRLKGTPFENLPEETKGGLLQAVSAFVDLMEDEDPTVTFHKKLNKIIAENADTIKESANKSFKLIEQVNSIEGLPSLNRCADLRQGDNKTMLELLNGYKVITKPELKSVLASCQLRGAGTKKIKDSESAQYIFRHLMSVGGFVGAASRETSFNNQLEYRILKHAAKHFGMADFRNANDFDRLYSNDEVIESIASKVPYIAGTLRAQSSLRTTNLRHNEHLTSSLICFMHEVYTKVSEISSGNLSLLSDEQYDLFQLANMIFVTQWSSTYSYRQAMLAFPSDVVVAVWNSSHINTSTGDQYMFDENCDITHFGEKLIELVDVALREHQDKDNQKHYPKDRIGFSSYVAMSDMPEFVSIISEIVERDSDLLETIRNSKLAKDLKDSDHLMKLSAIVGFARMAFKEVGNDIEDDLVKLTEKFDKYKNLSDKQVNLNSVALRGTLASFKKIYSQSALTSVTESIKTSADLGKQISELAEQGRYDEIAPVSQQAIEKKSEAQNALHKMITDGLDAINPVLNEKAKKESDAVTVGKEDIQAFNDTIGKQRMKIESLESGRSELTEKHRKLQIELDSSQSKVTALKKRLQGTGAGYSQAMQNILFGKPSCADVFDAINESYPYIVYADGFDKLVDECMYSQPTKLLQALKLLVDDYTSTINSGTPDSVAKNLIEPHYAANESPTTMSNERLKKMRSFTFNGKDIVMEQHLTIGSMRDKAKTVQVYFAIINELPHIGYVGEHLEISSN